MSEKWESESLRWIHSVRKRSYQKTKGKSLQQFSLGPSTEAKALAKKLGLKRAPFRAEKRPLIKSKARSR